MCVVCVMHSNLMNTLKTIHATIIHFTDTVSIFHNVTTITTTLTNIGVCGFLFHIECKHTPVSL